VLGIGEMGTSTNGSVSGEAGTGMWTRCRSDFVDDCELDNVCADDAASDSIGEKIREDRFLSIIMFDIAERGGS